MVKNEDVKQEFEMFAEVWNTFKRLLPVENTEEWWDTATKEMGKIYESRKTPLCKDVVLAIIYEFERRGKADDNLDAGRKSVN